jgi:hypothetical protein
MVRPVSEQSDELGDRQARVADDPAKSPGRKVLVAVYGHDGEPAFRVLHHVVTALDPCQGEAGLLQRLV